MTQLTTLANVKAYLAISTTGSDAIIATLIPRESAYVEQWTNRRFPRVVNTAKRLNGSGSAVLVLPDSPILSIESLTINGGTRIPASDGQTFGYLIDDSAISLIGGVFTKGRGNVVCSWTAGYRESETAFVPSGNTPTLSPTMGGTAVTNIGVSDANGAAFTLVGNAPAVGQYNFTVGTYTFSAADVGKAVTMDYYYVPGPVEQGCIEMIGLDLRQRDNLGVVQKQLANEFVIYSDKSMTRSVKEMLSPYRRMAPA